MSYSVSDSFHQWLVQLRRQFHQFPELGYQEKETGARICEVLQSFTIPFQSGVGKTGIVARLKAAHEGPLVAFRADMDALPLNEANDVPYKSESPGIMHACGHDAHITIALGVIRQLLEDAWPRNGSGEILFLFQPAEEGGAGAKAMLDSGIFDKEPVQAIFAGHVHPDLPAGHVGISPGIANAATDTFAVRLKGKGGHGAYPHQCKDPLVAGASLVTQLQTLVSRNIPPLDSAVLTIGQFHAGTASNIIPEEAFVEGTLRSLRPEVRDLLLRRLGEMVKGVEASFDLSASLETMEGYPLLTNTPELARHMKSCATEVLGADHVHDQNPSLGSEDFSYFCDRWGGVMVNLGCHNPQEEFEYGLHSPHFDIDEAVLDVGTCLFSHGLIQYIEKLK